MTLNQAYNLFLYTGIMLLDGQLISTSPDYIEEKTIKFFGRLGKPEFIEFPKIKFAGQKGSPLAKFGFDHYANIIDGESYSDEEDFWLNYCKLWKVKKDNYELMNIINFLFNIRPLFRSEQNKNTNLMLSQFKKYIGDLNIISDKNMDYTVHAIIRRVINENIDFDSRYLKLKILQGYE